MPASVDVTIVPVDLSHPPHADAVLLLLDRYAQDKMGGGKPLSTAVRQNLIPQLTGQPAYRGLLAMHGENFVGLANCFLAFSTFRAEPILNIHDLAVDPEYRGQGIGTQLLEAVDALARSEACHVVTLEVRADNPARRLYLRHGFNPGNPESDAMGFWKKSI